MPAKACCSRWVVLLVVGVAALVATTPLLAAPQTPDPLPAVFHVYMVVSGQLESFATGMEGLGDLTSAGNDGRGRAVKLQGGVRIIRGLTTNRDWWDWRQQVLTGRGRTAQRDVTITILDQTGTAVASWELKDAWPTNVTYSLKDNVTQEELELAYSGITRQ
ncbi:MAG TPA: phage tail protein [Vicinamibacteria bacterium]|nr:phage tail protein [Vicinamibacteria bacterium]